MPQQEQWPPGPDSCWGHCGYTKGLFGQLTRFNTPLLARYGGGRIIPGYGSDSNSSGGVSAGGSLTLSQYLYLSQIAAYEGHRAQFEGYTRQKHAAASSSGGVAGPATGFVQWMLNAALPSNIWHLIQWDLTPGATYFAAKKACAPQLAPIYSYAGGGGNLSSGASGAGATAGDGSVWLANNGFADVATVGATWQLVLSAEVRAINGSVLFTASQPVQAAPADSALPVLALPSQAQMASLLGGGATYFVRLLLTNQTFFRASGSSGSSGAVAVAVGASAGAGDAPAIVSENGYWLSTSPDVLDWAASTFYMTPLTAYADFSQLWRLPQVSLQVASASVPPPSPGLATIAITIASPADAAGLAFFIRARLVSPAAGGAASPDVAGAIWSDNFLPVLAPGESRTITVTYNPTAAPSGTAVLVETWNDQVYA